MLIKFLEQNLDHDRLAMKVFFNDLHPCKKNWSYEIKLIFEEINQRDQFNQPHQFDVSKAKCRLKINFIAYWKMNIMQICVHIGVHMCICVGIYVYLRMCRCVRVHECIIYTYTKRGTHA